MSRGEFTVALVGRPNVGKSTLFNRMARKRRAITFDQPGITRDLVAEPVEYDGHAFGWRQAVGEMLDLSVCGAAVFNGQLGQLMADRLGASRGVDTEPRGDG